MTYECICQPKLFIHDKINPMKKQVIPTPELLADMAALEIYGGAGDGGDFFKCTNYICGCNIKCVNCHITNLSQCNQPT